jgi:hypothetical protein
MPHVRDPIIKQAIEYNFELLTHDYKTVDGFINIDQAAMDSSEEFVESEEFLLQDSVHRLNILDWMFF